MNAPIQALLDQFNDVGFYAAYLDGTPIYAFREHELFFTASTSKIITAIALYNKLEQEGRTDNEILPFDEKDKIAGSGELQFQPPRNMTIAELVAHMLRISDNTAADIIINFVTKQYQTEVISKLNLTHTRLPQTNKEVVHGEYNLPITATLADWDNANAQHAGISPTDAISLDLAQANVSTPYEMHLALKELIEPTIISKKNADNILEHMKHCRRKNFFADHGVSIAHKTGGIPSVRVDAGIVYGNKPFYFVLMAKHITDLDEAMRYGKEIHTLIFNL